MLDVSKPKEMPARRTKVKKRKGIGKAEGNPALPLTVIYSRVATEEQLDRAAIYARVATSEDAPARIAAQEAACREYAAQNGLKVTHVFTDAAFSGTTLNHPQLKYLRRLVASDAVLAVIVSDWTRLSRNAKDLLKLKKEFAKRGVQIHNAK